MVFAQIQGIGQIMKGLQMRLPEVAKSYILIPSEINMLEGSLLRAFCDRGCGHSVFKEELNG